MLRVFTNCLRKLLLGMNIKYKERLHLNQYILL